MENKGPFGHKPPKYTFLKNPYSEYRASRCPTCNNNTYKRKFVLLVLVRDACPLALGLTCKYCSKCELIIAHQDELETELSISFQKVDLSKIGNDYFVVGTVDKNLWKKNIGGATDFDGALEFVSDFKSVLQLQYLQGGWYKK